MFSLRSSSSIRPLLRPFSWKCPKHTGILVLSSPKPLVRPTWSGTPPRTLQSQKWRNLSTSLPRRAQYNRFSSGPEGPSNLKTWDIQTVVATCVVAGGVMYYVAHLEKVPETGRWRFMDVNPKYEAELAKTSYAELVDEFGDKMLPPNHPLTRHVRRVVINILESSDLGTLRSDGPAPITTKSPDGDVWGGDVFREDSHSELVPGSGGREWNLLVVNDPKMINAMATVGNIVVFTGILPICKDEQGLAAVLSHEIGHVVARHISERYSSTKVLLFIALLLQASGLDFGVGKLATHLLLELPNSRTQETEADTIGMRLASKACYDPKAAVDVHVRLSEFEKMAGGSSGAEFLRTHPGAERRIKHLQELLPEGYSIRAGSSDCGGMQDSVDRFISAAQYYSFRQ